MRVPEVCRIHVAAGRWLLLILLLLACAALLPAQFHIRFDRQQNLWWMENGVVRLVLQLTPEGRFRLLGLTDLKTGHEWVAPPSRSSSPIRFAIGARQYDGNTGYRLLRQAARSAARGSYRQTIELEDLANTVRLILEIEVYDKQSAVRYRVRVQNLQTQQVNFTAADMLPWSFDDRQKSYTAFYVNQWVGGGTQGNFDPFTRPLNPSGESLRLLSGAHGQHCAWLALRDSDDNGVFAGWEFDGRTDGVISHSSANGALQLSAAIRELNRPVRASGIFASPWAFLGVFHGDWDEAGYLTQRFSEQAIARPVPERGFPYVMWDSWKYQTAINEQILRRNAEIASSLGVEVFVVDLGWARHIGDWHSDPAKFPGGLRALSDYVHSLGMKFGLHIPFAEASPESPILRQHPDWRSSKTYQYFAAESLCLSHQPVKQWIIAEILRIIDEYNVDWILQDGENMVKECTKTTHTHHPADSNFANAVDGLSAVVTAVQTRRPNVHWENCEDGGNMMTFNMVKNYVTSIAADDSGAMTTRQAIYGITYPFSPRYADRYMPDEHLVPYLTRSFMFGGPWILMNRLPAMDGLDLELLRSEIVLFKSLRERIRESRVYHLTARPDPRRIDALQSYHEATDTAIAFVFRPERAAAAAYRARLKGLNPDRTYRIRFQEDRRQLQLTGRQLLQTGVRVNLPERWWAEIVYVEPLEN